MPESNEDHADRDIFAPDAKTEVREELDFHVTMLTRQYVARGMSAGDAREAALRRMGDLQQLQRECRVIAEERNRTVRRSELRAELWQDVRYALRQLRRAPGFTAAAVLTIALGIAAASAIFGAIDAVLLQPLPLPGAEQLVVPRTQNVRAGEERDVAYADYEDWRTASVFESVAVFRRGTLNVSGSTDAEQVRSVAVSEDFFRTLRVTPALGPGFRGEDFRPGPWRVILSHGLWQRRFGGDPTIIGKLVHVGGLPREVAGVLPAHVGYPAEVEVWLANQVSPDGRAGLMLRDNFHYESIARLDASKTLAQTQTELTALAQRVAVSDPTTRADITVEITPLNEWTVGETAARTLWILFGAVGIVLLISCVNVMNLLLGRTAVRARELAIRTGLGATRARVMRQLITESVVLSVVGGALGVLLALFAVRLLVAAAPVDVPRLDAIAVNGRVLGFAFAAALFCSLAFGLLPALHAARTAVASTLATASGRNTWGLRARRGRGALAVAQIALALMLLIGASLLLRSFARLRGTDPGFETGNVLTFSLMLQGERYFTMPWRTAYNELRDRLAAMPGARSVAFASALPLGGAGFYDERVVLREGEPGESVNAVWSVLTPGYFRTLGIPLLEGRDFTTTDDRNATPVAVVNREFVRQLFDGESALGRRVRARDDEQYLEIVGVVDDVRFFGAGDPIRPLLYVPHTQDAMGAMVAVMRTDVSPHTLADEARRVVRAFDDKLGVGSVRTMEDVFSESVAASRFGAQLLGTFAALAFALALIGIYGVLSYDVTQRTRELGIRMALGARRSTVLGLVLRDAGLVVAIGVGLGVAGAWALTRYVRSLLYEVNATDPLTFIGVAATVAAVALAASLVPGRRAAAVDPMRALRAE